MMRHARRSAVDTLGMRFGRLDHKGNAALVLALVALWLLGRSYGGIMRDATVYLAQGLRQLDPAAFDRDIFFAYGSQDAYTVFPLIYARLIDALGAATAAIVVTLLGQVAFVASAWLLSRRMVPAPARWWSLALLATGAGYYGGGGIFHLAEPIATARALAEPLVLGALAASLHSRTLVSASSLALAAALHPLIAAPGIIAVYLWHASQRPRLLWALPVALGAFGALALGHFLPLIDLTEPLDAVWREALLVRSPHLFVAQWPLPDWARIAWGTGVVLLATQFLAEPARRMTHAVLVAAWAGIAASWIGVDLLGSAGAASLQMWRGHWLLHGLALVLVPVLVSGLWQQGNTGRLAAALAAASCCYGRAELPVSAALLAASFVLHLAGRGQARQISDRLLRFGVVAAACAAAVGLMFEFQSRLPPQYIPDATADWSGYAQAARSIGGLLPLAALLWIAARSRFAPVALALSLCLTLGAGATWDARTPWTRFLEYAAESPNPFRSQVPHGAQVYWPGDRTPAWQVLRGPSWVSVDQGAGIIFSRRTAAAYAARLQATAALWVADRDCQFLNGGGAPLCMIDASIGADLCTGDIAPDYLVLHSPLSQANGVIWTIPEITDPARHVLHLYACASLTRSK